MKKTINMNNNHYKSGFIIGSTIEIPVELILLHVKKIGGVLER